MAELADALRSGRSELYAHEGSTPSFGTTPAEKRVFLLSFPVGSSSSDGMISPPNMKSDSHTIAVVIPSLERETLQLCLDALDRQTRPPDEVIVIRDTEHKGSAYGRNKGIEKSTSDLIAMTDDDCVPPDNWLENMLTIMDEYDADVVGGTMVESDPLLNAIRKRRPFPSSVQVDHTGIVGNTANILYRRSLLDECLKQAGHIFTKTGEDIELIWRIQQMGAKVVYSPNPVLHMRKITAISYLKRQFTRGIAIATLFRASRKAEKKFVAQPSLLWGQGKTENKANWFKAVVFKIIGPFDIHSFDSVKDYFVFWLGEKIQGAGFVWGLLTVSHLEQRYT